MNFFNCGRRRYGSCQTCGGIFAASSCFLFKTCQKQRYLRHNNSLDNEGYRQFLKSFIDPVLERLPFEPDKILDYGSGPKAALTELLEHYKQNGRLRQNCEIRGWDPFFAPETRPFEGGASLVTCLETIEHFENPAEDFAEIGRTLCPGGIAAAATQLLPEDGGFLSWWYKEDPTHVAFYTEKALQSAAQRGGLQLEGTIGKRIFLLRKKN